MSGKTVAKKPKTKSKAKSPKAKTTPKKRRRRKSAGLKIGWPIKIALLIALSLFLMVGGYVFYCWLTLPDISNAVEKTRLPTAVILASDRREIESYGSGYGEVVYAEQLPPFVIDAVISTEDRRFYSHSGFDWVSFSRAMIVNLFHRRYVQGASTITQQVSKNLFLSPQKNIKRKVQELLMSLWLEKKFTKNQILTLYLNRVYMGGGAYGIEAASQKFFHKSSYNLNVMEAAVLAGLLKAPARYNPLADKKRSLERAKVVLQNMVDNHKLSEAEKAKALTMPVGNGQNDSTGGKYFADWVYGEISSYIGDNNEDIEVYTTLDSKIQKAAEEVLTKFVTANHSQNVNNGAIVVVDNDGAVKAMVGGISYRKSQFNRATKALRQPGSSFKTFVYLAALEAGFEPDDIIDDVPLNNGKWRPENYDKKYYGKVSLRDAFRRSLNLASINLVQRLAGRQVVALAHRMGITTPIENSPAMALGSSEVKIMDMAIAYSCIANGGMANWPYAVIRISNREGQTVYQREKTEKNRIINEDANQKITSMLQSVISSGTGKKARLPIMAAGKTGTSQDYRDAWFVGFANGYTVAVWLGNDDNSPMKGIGGGTLPAEIWRELMLRIMQQ